MNTDFLKTIFRENYINAHVTDFPEDPLEIPQERRFIAWGGDYYQNYKFNSQKSNQYFTISLFNTDELGKARRRKSTFIATYLVVLDDVKEKLSYEVAKTLPTPTYIMETSPGSEQWGYVLTTPCEDMNLIDNLMDGLIQSGLAPDSKDPGMKGVTRYVRLPDGYNTKKSKMIDGEPYKCQLLSWCPFITVSLEDIAKPLNIDLNVQRREHVNQKTIDIPDHPIFETDIKINKVLSPGRFDITCPWVDEHTGAVDNGTAIFTNSDGSMGFKCHHGACQDRTCNDLFRYLDKDYPNFSQTYKLWSFKHLMSNTVTPSESRSLDVRTPPQEDQKQLEGFQDILKGLELLNPRSKEAREMASNFLKIVEDESSIDRQYYHTEVCDMMGWTKSEFTGILKDLRAKWYEKDIRDFYKNIIFVIEQNRFYDKRSKLFMTPDCFQNAFSHEDSEAKKEALMNGRVEKVDKMDFAPKMPPIFKRGQIVYGNTWVQGDERLGVEGDATPWLNHFDVLNWGEHKKHILQWMAYTILHPEHKINHILVLGGNEGIGKDFLLYPLEKAMGEHSRTEQGVNLLSDFNSYLMNTKYLNINETELGDHKEATRIRNKIKPLAAAPPETLSVNQKGIAEVDITNLVNVTMTTNSQMPFKLDGSSRRYYAMWSELNTRDESNQVRPEWLNYFKQMWTWMKNGGVDYCIYYLRNHVDLSDFEPSTPPPVTEFLQSIQDASKSPGQQTIEAFIENKMGAFANDLITAQEATQTLKSGIIGFDAFMFTEPTWFTPNRVAMILRDIPTTAKLRARGEVDLRIYALRNKEHYLSLSTADLYATYINQKK